MPQISRKGSRQKVGSGSNAAGPVNRSSYKKWVTDHAKIHSAQTSKKKASGVLSTKIIPPKKK